MTFELPSDCIFESGERHRAVGEKALEAEGEFGERDVADRAGAKNERKSSRRAAASCNSCIEALEILVRVRALGSRAGAGLLKPSRRSKRRDRD
jgi:hypothetical protein